MSGRHSTDAILYLRKRLVANRIARLKSSSKPRFLMATFAAVSLWALLFFAFYVGFEFLDRHGLATGYLIDIVFGLFFATLTIMLIFSTGVLTYASLFASSEARFLLVRPIAPDWIFAFKLEESFFLGSWAFFVIGSPLMIAYGISTEAPASFFGFALLFFASFGLLPSCLGALLCLGINALFPRRRRELLFAISIALVAFVAYRGFSFWEAVDDESSLKWVSQFVVELDVGRLPFLPSHWMSAGVLSAARPGGLMKAFMYLLVTVSQGAMAYLITAYSYRRFYRKAYDRVHSHRPQRSRTQTSIMPRIVNVAFFWLPPHLRMIIAKDLRTFSRDPVQFLQLLVFSGLIVLYVLALSRFREFARGAYWETMVGFLNLGIMAPFLSILASRFIFPLQSLEAQKLWILGQAPISRQQILWAKFLFSTAGSLCLAVALTLGSAWIIGLDMFLTLVHLGAVAILAPGVCGIAVGLGGRFIELHESDPGKIASGLPGAMNMMLAMIFILLVVMALAIPFHLEASHPASGLAQREFATPFYTHLSISFAWSLALGALTVWLPMRMGIRHFTKREL